MGEYYIRHNYIDNTWVLLYKGNWDRHPSIISTHATEEEALLAKQEEERPLNNDEISQLLKTNDK